MTSCHKGLRLKVMNILLFLALAAQTGAPEYDFSHLIQQGETEDGFYVMALVSIPYSTLQFVREDSFYRARYQVVLQLVDRNKNIYGTEAFGKVNTLDQEALQSQSRTVAETLEVEVPKGKYEGSMILAALEGTRRVEKEFEIDIYHRALGDASIADKQGSPGIERSFQSTDTLSITVPVYEQDLDSVQLQIKGMRNYRNTRPVEGNEVGWEIPLIGFVTGEYNLIALAFKDGKERDKRETEFTVRNPFRFDPRRYQELVDKLVYITTPDERARMKSAEPEHRQAVWDSFWKEKDPTPQTSYNEALESYFAKIRYCEENFSRGDRGYLSDRARIYMRFGEPDEVEEHPFDMDRYPYIVWYYYHSDMKFIFEDRLNFGEYELVYPPGYLPPW